jgi:acetyl esterase/lipase
MSDGSVSPATHARVGNNALSSPAARDSFGPPFSYVHGCIGMSEQGRAQALGRVRVEEAVVVGKAGTRELRCDLFHPPEAFEAAAGRSAVLLIHGGAWSHGDRNQLRGYGILLARRGYLCATLEYRLSGEVKWPAQLHDLKTAIRWVRANSAQWAVDPAKICVAGNSAGGHLALMLAATAEMPEFEGRGGHAGVSTACAACIAIYAPTKLFGERHPSAYAPGLFAEGIAEDEARRASPIEYARPEFPPTLLIHGNRDEVVSPLDSLIMYQALSARRAPVELHMYDGLPHGFDVDREYGRHCAELMLLFLDSHVVNPQKLQSVWSLERRSPRAAVR